MVAVSGAHLSVVAALAGALLARARMPRVALSIALCLFYCAYAAFTGFSAPVIRAALMAAVVVSAIWGARRSSSLAALGVCVCVLLAVHPANALSLSFFLSAASTLGIVALAPLMQAWFEVAFGRRAETLCQTCALTTAANIPIAPVTACVFSRVPLMSPLANDCGAPVYGFHCRWSCWAGAYRFVCAGRKAILAAIIALAQALSAFLAALGAFPSRLFHVRPTCGLLSPFPHWRCGPVGHMAPSNASACSGGWGRHGACGGGVRWGGSIARAPTKSSRSMVGQGDAILVKSEGLRFWLTRAIRMRCSRRRSLERIRRIFQASRLATTTTTTALRLTLLRPPLSGRAWYVARETYACPCDGCADLLARRNISGAPGCGA